ncbi:unnamed protein product [Pseudo-nitzschia multistriata]|uniref:HECT-type E3 ubiquitin transferase n=1 Tax=Pseudo-nitzschia multistriata TaxID=183589 RepID=A0A448ZA13_9STRA|nr:unnamed protein product [Pseudo-nitzschia multistriata]
MTFGFGNFFPGPENNINSNTVDNSSNNNSINNRQAARSTYPGQRGNQQRDSVSTSGNTAENNGTASHSIGVGVANSDSRGVFNSLNSSSSSYSNPSMPSSNGPYVTRGSSGAPNGPYVVRGSNPGQQSTSSRNSTSSLPHVPPRSNVGPTGSIGSSSNNNSASQLSPGAYIVTRSVTSSSASQIYRVTIPPGVASGSEFTVHAGNRRVRVVCPASSRPGQSLQITLPPEPTTSRKLVKPAPITLVGKKEALCKDPFMRQGESSMTGGAVEMLKEVEAVNKAATDNGGTPRTYVVTIPMNVRPGEKFRATFEGQRFEVTCPSNAGPGMKVRIVAPPSGQSPSYESEGDKEPQAAAKMQVFEVVVPNGVRPNQPFTLMANGQRVLVTCPPKVYPGSKIRFQLPVPETNTKTKTRLVYKDGNGSTGWERTVRVQDMKFQWVRVTDESDNMGDNKKKLADSKSLSNTLFDDSQMAFVRQIQFLEGNDARMRTGKVSLVLAQKAVVDSKYVDKNYQGTGQTKTLFSYANIESVQSKSLNDKVEWFRNSVCKELFRPWEQGHVKIVIRREVILEDSLKAILALGRDDMRKRWRIEFSGEPGIEAGGLTREWFQLVTERIFDPALGLWMSSENNQMEMNINFTSYLTCGDAYLKLFRFLGRVMGRALFDGQLIKGHMSRYLYKHLLGWPVTFADIEAHDEQFYKNLKNLAKMDDPSLLDLNFTVTEDTIVDGKKGVPLIPDGARYDLTSENLDQYLKANLHYRMLNRCKPQITELLLGFYDIIPEAALTVFDPNELELILCGIPTIDMEDWTKNTKYSGIFESTAENNQVVKWFWDVVKEDFDQEMKARLLQFVTGTSGVPPGGFSVLQGNDNNIKLFCVHGVSRDQYVYPRAHTCFNRIDLPNYATREELANRVKQAVSMTYVGFDIE